MHAGASIPPETMMHFPPVSDFPPPFSKNFLTLKKIFTILPFSEKFLDFHPPKFLMTFFSHRPQILNSPIFPVSVHFPPISRKLLFPTYFDKFPPILDNFICFLHTLRVFRYPLLLPMHVLDASDCAGQDTSALPMLSVN